MNEATVESGALRERARGALYLLPAAALLLAWPLGTYLATFALIVLASREGARLFGAFSGAASERRIALLMGAPDGTASLQLGLFDDSDAAPGHELDAPALPDRGEELDCLRRLADLARNASGAESKLGALHRLLSRVTEPAIVFTEYRDTLDTLAQAVRREPCRSGRVSSA